jgi:hypothetical protein
LKAFASLRKLTFVFKDTKIDMVIDKAEKDSITFKISPSLEKRTSIQNYWRALPSIKTIESDFGKEQKGEDDTFEKEPRKMLKICVNSILSS